MKEKVTTIAIIQFLVFIIIRAQVRSLHRLSARRPRRATRRTEMGGARASESTETSHQARPRSGGKDTRTTTRETAASIEATTKKEASEATEATTRKEDTGATKEATMKED